MTLTSELAELLARPDLALVMADINVHLRAEAEKRARFREEVTPDIKAEFINGEVVLHSPAQLRHLQVTRRLALLLGTFVQRHRLGEVLIEKAMIEATRNDYEPDVVFFGRVQADTFTPDQLLLPMPDFIVEVLSPSTEKRDRGVKFRDYAAHGVREYWIVDAEAGVVETYELTPVTRAYGAAGYFPNHAGGDVPLLHSAVVPGFAVPVRALFDDEANNDALAALFAAPAPPVV